jgi:hypothetical protein
MASVHVPSVPAPAPPAGLISRPARGWRDTRLFRACASLRLAITLLALFAGCLALGTLLESAYGAPVAGQLVYRTWWFALLLVALCVNVLCAALKKYPWKRHQVGFLITHAGLLVLFGGGLLTSLAGTEGQMLLLDTEDPALQVRFRLSDRADTIQLTGRHRLEFFRVPDRPTPEDPVVRILGEVLEDGLDVPPEALDKLQGHYWSVDFNPGVLPWHADAYCTADMPRGLRLLQTLADPLPALRCELGDAVFTAENFYPHTEAWPYRKADPGEGNLCALRIKLTTSMTPIPLDRWLDSAPDFFRRDPLPLAMELLTLDEPALLPEFLAPPAKEDLGEQGRLVLLLGREGQRREIDLDTVAEGKAVPLEGTEWTFTLLSRGDLYDLLGGKEAKAKRRSPYPAVRFALERAGERGEYLACPRVPGMPAFHKGQPAGPVAAWYHPPEPWWAGAGKKGALQFLRGPEGKLYYRVSGEEGLRSPARELDPTDPERSIPLPMGPMEMRLRVAVWLPSATRRPSVVPRDVPVGAEPAERFEPGLRGRLAVGARSEEVWLRMGREPTPVRIGEALYFVRYRRASRLLDFSLRLKEARQENAPGTDRPASYHSKVVLAHGKGPAKESEEHTIAMNQTLDHAGYKVYQTSYRPMTDPRTMQPVVDRHGRPVSLSGLTVAHDPGLWCKYAGSFLLVLGIATMFFMRAYLFAPRRRASLS